MEKKAAVKFAAFSIPHLQDFTILDGNSSFYMLQSRFGGLSHLLVAV
ncbi:hypothetical protein [Mesobacillus persicus]|nr:hypothetical protein [Mesobacillus persicus]